MSLPDVVGLIGAVFYLAAYALLQLHILTVEDSRTTLLNVLGGICLIYSLSCNFNLGSLVTQIAWLIFTLIGYVRFRVGRARQ